MDKKTVRCNNCMTVFSEKELIQISEITDNEEEIFTGCPNCKTDEWLMNLDNE